MATDNPGCPPLQDDHWEPSTRHLPCPPESAQDNTHGPRGPRTSQLACRGKGGVQRWPMHPGSPAMPASCPAQEGPAYVLARGAAGRHRLDLSWTHSVPPASLSVAPRLHGLALCGSHVMLGCSGPQCRACERRRGRRDTSREAEGGEQRASSAPRQHWSPRMPSEPQTQRARGRDKGAQARRSSALGHPGGRHSAAAWREGTHRPEPGPSTTTSIPSITEACYAALGPQTSRGQLGGPAVSGARRVRTGLCSEHASPGVLGGGLLVVLLGALS